MEPATFNEPAVAMVFQAKNSVSVLLRGAIVGIGLIASTALHAGYEIGSRHIIKEVFTLSREIKSLELALDSTALLVDSEANFFLPKVNVTAEHKHFDGQVAPVLEKDSELNLGITARLFSDVTKERLQAANKTRIAAYLQLVGRKSEIYYTVMEQLIKVERNREFLKESEAIKAQLQDYLEQIERSVAAGVSPRSYLRESQLIKVRFQDVVATAQSNIDRYFTDLSLSTGYLVKDTRVVGVNTANVFIALNYKPAFNVDEAIENNIGILIRQYEVESLRHTANVQHEKLKVSFFNDTKVGLMETQRNEFLNVRETSVAGVRVEFNLFDYQRSRTKEALFEDFLSERELLDDEIEKLNTQIVELKNRYENAQKKRQNLKDQIELSQSLLEAQENEILVDRIKFIDIMKSLSDMIQTRVSYLNNDINLLETVFDYQRIVNSGLVGY